MTLLFIPVLIALLPAAFAFWTGRRLASLADDAALAERLLADRTRNAFVFAFCFALLTVTFWKHAAWAIPLLIVTRLAVGYRIRKALYGETWGFGGYLSFFSRLIVVAFGFWVTVGSLPIIAMLAGSRDWVLGAVLAALLAGWAAAYGRVFCTILRGKPVCDRAILPRFAQMVTQCGLGNVSLQQVDMCGGAFANAVALPSSTHPAVLVSSTLIERLDTDETAGILAHELAHIEHYNPRVLRGAARVTYALVGASALVAPLTRLVPQSGNALVLLWPLVVLATLVARARDRQKHETESDLRAVALTGNADALIRALTKLHALARIPRRWDTEFERRATHPSLARRIQAIHAAGTPSPSLGEAATFNCLDGKRSVTFHADRLVLNEGAAGQHSIDYGLLTALRVDVKPSGAARLIAVDCSNRRWDIVLHQQDLGPVQAALDVVDTRLGTVASRVSTSSTGARALAVATVIIAAALGQYSVALVGWLGAAHPASPLMAAAGAAAIGGAALSWRDRLLWATDAHPWMALALLVCGLALMTLKAMTRQEETSPWVQRLIGALALAALLACGLAVASGGTDAMSLHRSAREWPSAAVMTLSLAGALAFAQSSRIRYAAAPFACAGLIAIFLGSTAFLDRFVSDPFLAPAEPLTVRTLTDTNAEFTVPFDASELWLSPSGRFVALASENSEEQIAIHAGRAGGGLDTFEADEAMFVDEGRLLLLGRQRSATVLRVVDLESGNREVWSRRLPLWAVRLSFNRTSGAWRLLGWNDTGDIASVAGQVGQTAMREERWTVPASDVEGLETLAVSKGNVLTLETEYPPNPLGYGLFGRWTPLIQPVPRTKSRFWAVGQHHRSPLATSQLDVACRSMPQDDEPATCTAFDGTRTRFVAIDAATRRLTALGSVTGRFYSRSDAGRGWLLGWWEQGVMLVRPSTREAIRVAPPDGWRPFHLAMGESVVGAASSNAHGSTVRLYAMEPQN